MKIIHIESGLGNQMLSYCEYLAIKKMNPNENCYIETIIYDIPECNNVICQWNGYELERIFGIKAPNIKDYCEKEQWNRIIQSIKESRFWEKNWNYPVWFTKAFNENGFNVINIRGDFEEPNFAKKFTGKKTLKSKLIDTKLGDSLKRLTRNILKKYYIDQVCEQDSIFYTGNDDIFTGQRLSFKYIGNGIEKIEREIKEAFTFPKITDEKNLNMLNTILSCESVAIHARRGDMLGYNRNCYKYGYFKRAVKYIKKHISDPVFIFFCDPGSIEWCKENQDVFGLDLKKDRVLFTDWNKGTESYRDMQLMSQCKHAIITNSSFGWWGAYLIKNPNKITCSPDITINTTHHF